MIKEIRRTELINARKLAGMNQLDAAYMAGISGSMYQRIEAGYNDPNPEAGKRIIELFHLPEDYFNKKS